MLLFEGISTTLTYLLGLLRRLKALRQCLASASAQDVVAAVVTITITSPQKVPGLGCTKPCSLETSGGGRFSFSDQIILRDDVNTQNTDSA